MKEAIQAVHYLRPTFSARSERIIRHRPVTRLFYAAFIHKEYQRRVYISGYKLNFKGGFEPKNYP